MPLLTLALAGILSVTMFPSASPVVTPLGRLDSDGRVEVCNGAPVSASHLVTLYGFVHGAAPFAITDEGRILPDSTVFFGDLGLAMLIFEGEPFRRWNTPCPETVSAGEAFFVAGYRSDGITMQQTRVLCIRNDGSALLSTAPAPGLMGAGAYDASGRLRGVVTGTVSDSSGDERLAMLPSQLWLVWCANLVDGVGAPATPFGVSAIAYTCGEVDDEAPSGILIIDVCTGSRAERCGLQKGDIVLNAGGMRVYHPESLRGMVQSGGSLELTVHRSGGTVRLTVPGE